MPLIEDAAEALGATYKGRPAGTLGTSGVFSFNGNKIMTTSGGGAFLSPNPVIADRVRFLAAQAREPVPGYHHLEIGYNYRLSNLLAAIGRAQLARLPEMSARRAAYTTSYRAALDDTDDWSFMPIAPWGGWNGWLTCLTFNDPDPRRGRARPDRCGHRVSSRCGSPCTCSQSSNRRLPDWTARASISSPTGCACRAAAR